MAGILGVVAVNGNGFYQPSNDELVSLVKEGAKCVVDLQASTFPLELTLVGHQRSEGRVYRQELQAMNANQVRHMYNHLARYAVILPTACLNDSGRALPTDWIASTIQVDELKAIK
jgi:hypothetical protein